METNLFRTWISQQGLKATRQREQILAAFLSSKGHQNLAQIYGRVAKVNPRIGYVTVYRTLRLLTRCGLAAQRKFADGEIRYEPVSGRSHHDHLICLSCGKIIEFENQAIESLQDRIAEHHQFNVFHHRMELYGQCSECSRKKAPRRRKS
ncbi:MAG: transcriptional repressor [Deltaproteobacteria bacterium RBG_13_53_10]|nr:MAG: transcriptional repressor [Deltaproteobacteria bacterium RBG_13_53_10]